MKRIVVYKITNIISNHIYIGLSRNLGKRFYNHKYKLRKGLHENEHLQKSWNKYGEQAFVFEIIEECKEEELNDREIYWINFYGGFENPSLYNIRDGGNSLKHSLETIEKIRESNLGSPCYWKGKHLPPEIIKKISKANKGRKLTEEQKIRYTAVLEKYWKDRPGYWTGKTMSEEHRRKLSEAHKGQKSWNKGNCGMISEETRRKLSEAHKGHHQSAETRAKISKGHLGRKKSAETRRRMSEAQRGVRRLWLNKDGKTTSVLPEKLELYLEQGWKRGRIPRKEDEEK